MMMNISPHRNLQGVNTVTNLMICTVKTNRTKQMICMERTSRMKQMICTVRTSRTR